ncbi:hypothetical protein C900_00136 [Fulvivirga imtechensis AK7]|uniref:Lipocalin-like domain-containing protein n=1 Tax=Fulvivirga imtechensis AK7 TaxID=1237149 RepID=L8JVH6_9BACT|nr:lipocalin-like domain-containing protein [Fulvivirga imtechensis]ELR73056.1 hypothetical protein C900_00136 [Fulvivirga imtechensis AK7]
MELQDVVPKIAKDVIGTWKLVSWTFKNEHGKEVNYFGTNPAGILMYTESGYMSVHIMKENRTKFKSEGMYDGTSEEITEAFKTYFAYFGKFIESAPGVLRHTVEGGTFPNWLGNVEERYGKIMGNKLVLSTPPIHTEGRDIVFDVVWQRV